MARGALQGVAMVGAVVVAGVVAYAMLKRGAAAVAAAPAAAASALTNALGNAWDTTSTRVSDAAAGVLSAITNPDNPVATRANAVVQQVTGDPYSTVGTKLFEYLNPSAMAAERALFAPSARPSTEQRALLAGTSFWDEDASAEDYAAAAADDADLDAGNAALAMRGIAQGYSFTPPAAIDAWGRNLRGRR